MKTADVTILIEKENTGVPMMRYASYAFCRSCLTLSVNVFLTGLVI
jgi:hypothetical protein